MGGYWRYGCHFWPSPCSLGDAYRDTLEEIAKPRILIHKVAQHLQVYLSTESEKTITLTLWRKKGLKVFIYGMGQICPGKVQRVWCTLFSRKQWLFTRCWLHNHIEEKTQNLRVGTPKPVIRKQRICMAPPCITLYLCCWPLCSSIAGTSRRQTSSLSLHMEWMALLTETWEKHQLLIPQPRKSWKQCPKKMLLTPLRGFQMFKSWKRLRQTQTRIGMAKTKKAETKSPTRGNMMTQITAPMDSNRWDE